MSVDLHLHTHHSDGTWSPERLVEHAVSLRLKHIAVTDHDTVFGVKEAIKAANQRLEVIPGVEINTVVRHSSGEREDIHILGYFIDIEHGPLLALLQRQRDARLSHAQSCVERLNSAGVAVTLEMVQKFSSRGSIGKAHLTQAIISAGGAQDAEEAYEKFLSRSSKYYVERQSASPQEAIAAINAAGGIASIAHPGKAAHVDALILKLKQDGLRAVEAYHRMHSVNWVKHYIRLANKNGLLITGGSDCHGPFKEYGATVGSISVPVSVVEALRQAARTPALL